MCASLVVVLASALLVSRLYTTHYTTSRTCDLAMLHISGWWVDPLHGQLVINRVCVSFPFPMINAPAVVVLLVSDHYRSYESLLVSHLSDGRAAVTRPR